VNVQYAASVTGDGLFSSITYAGPSGNVTVTNPTMPFSVMTTVTLPTQASMSASASTNNGSATISYTANIIGGNSSDQETGDQTCSTGNN
jgi:hypothetical protein